MDIKVATEEEKGVQHIHILKDMQQKMSQQEVLIHGAANMIMKEKRKGTEEMTTCILKAKEELEVETEIVEEIIRITSNVTMSIKREKTSI